MGIEIHITIPHNIRNLSLENVVETFRPVNDAFAEVFQYYAKKGYQCQSPTWALQVMDDFQKEWDEDFYGFVPVAFDAPAGFGFHFGPHAISIHHHTRLERFCSESTLRQLIRRFTFRILESTAGRSAIYSPDDYGIYDLVFFGKTFAEIEEHLRRRGLVTNSFAELSLRYCYIDGFEDYQRDKATLV